MTHPGRGCNYSHEYISHCRAMLRKSLSDKRFQGIRTNTISCDACLQKGIYTYSGDKIEAYFA